MKQALVIINEESGGYRDSVRTRIAAALADYTCRYADIDADYATWALHEVDLLVVVGGDGTLSSVLNKIGTTPIDVLYVPCGTLNERAKARRRFALNPQLVLGRYDDAVYAYVLAAGSFTPIGYVTDVRAKKQFGRLAYLARVLREYRVHAIEASITADGVSYDGTYTLIMSVKSDRCFGFRFNRAYRPDDTSGHLLLIKSPASKGLGGKIRMFFPFFRAFFVGFGREYHSRNVDFVAYRDARLALAAPCDFDVDGEKRTLCGAVSLSFETYPASFDVLTL